MKRAFVVALFCVAVSAQAAEKWWDAYNRGVAAVNGKNYEVAAASLTQSIAGNATESTGVRAGNTIITYVPHFWLGIAKFELGDTDGALREWRVSEEQGAIARTSYYPLMKGWIARADAKKQQVARTAVSGPKKAAEAAISRAMQLQGDALSAGGDRTPSYGDAQRKLQGAVAQLRKAGTDATAYNNVAQSAEQAAQLFASASEEGKKLKAAAAARPKPVKPQPQAKAVVAQVVAPPVPVPVPAPIVVPQPEATPAPVVSQAKVAAEVAVQEYRRKASRRDGEALRKQLANAKSDADYDRVRLEVEKRLVVGKPEPVPAAVIAVSAPMANVVTVDVTAAYRAFAAGNFEGAERLLNAEIAKSRAAEAYLLRGCVRYTRALLARRPDAAAISDFQAALQQNRAVRLDPRAFSPKLVARFDQVRNSR
jgi:hypothetical protein